MPARSRSMPNPFYVILVIASTAFVITVFGYLIAPVVQRRAREDPKAGPGPGSIAMADRFERHATMALTIEIGVMTVSGLLAMTTDHLFSGRKAQA